ncbi:hypothetical protein LguiB_015858 [Lonicera macranthoides]
MEFWGAEVKSGEPFLVNPGEGTMLHLSQACLGEVKKDKGSESISLYLNIDGKRLVLGTLNSEKLPQQLFDLVFDRNFELSHSWKNGSVYFYGYKAANHDQYPFLCYDSDSEEDVPLLVANNGKQVKPPTVDNPSAVKDSAPGKKVKIVEPKDVKPEEEDSSDDSDAMSEDESDSEEDSESGSDDDDEDEDSDEVEETPKKAEPSKKRPTESTTKTPLPSKKAKVVTPQKTDGKKGGVHVATPHPSKKAGKTPATLAAAVSKSTQQSPKSEGSHSCKTCNRSFKSDGALDSHNKAKHSSGK